MTSVRWEGKSITPFLSFNQRNAEDAVGFYLSVFADSKRIGGARVPEGYEQVGEAGSVLTIEFELLGQRFVALNGGPQGEFNQAISLVVHCETQSEIDRYWERLGADGGKHMGCGWVKDRFGVSWQIVPARVFEWIHDAAVASRVLSLVWTMNKLDLAKLEAAARG